MSFRDDVVAAARKAGGSFKTVAQRSTICRSLSDYLKDSNIQIKTLVDLKEKHVKGFFESTKLTNRTLQNRLSAIRTTLRAAGLTQKAKSLTSERLGISGASRDGTRSAISKADFDARIVNVVDPGVRCVLELQNCLGLRQLEAIMGGREDTLSRWERELTSDAGRIFVGEGTKTGKTRETLPVDKERALAAVRSAKAVAAAQPGGRLIAAKGLKEAVVSFNNKARAAGFTGVLSPHSNRYAFAQASIARYEAAGCSRREALAFTSRDMGHGDGRGRWINQVYCKNKKSA